MTKNAYIHIPFCSGKCNYCSFVSFDKLESKENYLNALKKQIHAEYKGESLNTLYFGGGTPSLLTIDEIDNLLELFNFESKPEITLEINPEGVNEKYLRDLKNIGINRVSIGVQTFNDEILKLIGRRHNSKQIIFALNCALKAGFDNISMDLIYGLPKQGINDFSRDLKTVSELGIQHVSLYGLKIEEGCYFYKNPPKHLFPDLDIQADMYSIAIEILTSKGFEHYEISNFGGKCKGKSFVSRHNLNYWNNNTYYGFGCSASGYIDSIRYQNEPDLDKYIQNPLKKDFEQKLSEEEILEEAIFLGLRKIAGINTNEINESFGINFDIKYASILEKYSKYFVKTYKGWALNRDGLLISNEILAEFINC